jgi:DNA replication and repair protein RecF
VLFHPGDLALGTGPADGRRAFLDRLVEQMEPSYGTALGRYTKALRSRNRLLKSEQADRRSIEAYDAVLATEGARVGVARARAVSDLAPRVVEAFAEIGGEPRPLAVHYRPRVEPTSDAIRLALGRSFEKDRARGFTAEGPHGDDLAFEVRDVVARHHASQGQHRTIVLALKVAELDVLSARVGRIPILLLDDVSSELDRGRNRRFFALLARLGGQVFLTTTHSEFILLDASRTDFRVEGGTVSRV